MTDPAKVFALSYRELERDVERLRAGGRQLDGVIRRLSDENERLREALRLALDTLGANHHVVEGPNARWREECGGWFDEDLIPAPDCAVCKAEAVARDALAARGEAMMPEARP